MLYCTDILIDVTALSLMSKLEIVDIFLSTIYESC